ncbi:hypothetical protein MMC25_002493 [Agyrium rufum]|nr:hypothetical protein [Agyrium rufum]
MASLNLSTNGPSISNSYKSVVDSPPASGQSATSSTYGQWAVYSVSAPLANAFQQDSGNKESILKVQSTGEGELIDLIEEFSDGRIQYAFVKVKDPNTSLPKNVLIGWCGEGVPERTKGYFTSHTNAVAKVLQGYHIQITARSDRDLTPESIVQKVADSSGSRYSGGGSSTAASKGPHPPATNKPVFTPTVSSMGSGGFNPLANSRSRNAGQGQNVDEDGWGADAPPVTRTQLEKVHSSYTPTKVNMKELTSQQREPLKFNGFQTASEPERSDVVRGGYQPIGKVDIAALRKEAQGASTRDDRPSTVKGAYEPVGKVDIATIRARAQGSSGQTSPPSRLSPAATGTSATSDRSAPFTSSERLTTLPKPKVANRFGSSNNAFTGTTAPTPGGFGFGAKPAAPAPPVGVGKNFADQAGKTPAQIWAEKKARERGLSGSGDKSPGLGGPVSPITSQKSGGEGWKSGYAGKSWGPVSTSKTGQSASSMGQQRTGEEPEAAQEEAPASPAGGISALRDRFKAAPPMGAPASTDRSTPEPPQLDMSSKPSAPCGVPMPGLPMRPKDDEEEEQAPSAMPVPPPATQPRPEPEEEDEEEAVSPIRVAMPVGRGSISEVENAHEEQMSPPPSMPARSLGHVIPQEDEMEEEHHAADAARGAGAAMATSSFGQHKAETAQPGGEHSGKRAIAQYDYEKAEDNELELKEGEEVSNVEMVDDDWWMGQNSRGETGLFPSNYVELVEDDRHTSAAPEPSHPEPPTIHEPEPEADEEPQHHAGGSTAHQGTTATALYDYEAAEDNEISFPDGATVTNIEFPDDDWWSGHYGGKEGLFPANYVKLDE